MVLPLFSFLQVSTTLSDPPPELSILLGCLERPFVTGMESIRCLNVGLCPDSPMLITWQCLTYLFLK